MLLIYSVLICAFSLLAHTATVTYDWNITWVTANPDGQVVRPVMGINGQWPPPHLMAAVGDRVVVNVYNQLGNQTASLHFHGLYMNGTAEMDGAVGVTQCPIGSGELFTYNFTVSDHAGYDYSRHLT